jgi:hypothetical protein
MLPLSWVQAFDWRKPLFLRQTLGFNNHTQSSVAGVPLLIGNSWKERWTLVCRVTAPSIFNMACDALSALNATRGARRTQ